MRLNSKGQVTIPAELRRSHGFVEGDEVDVVADGATLRLTHADAGDAPRITAAENLRRFTRAVARMSGRLVGHTTDELMRLLRDE